jgi:hypothetical protein
MPLRWAFVAGRHSPPTGRAETPPAVDEAVRWGVPKHRSSAAAVEQPTAVCPECGAMVPVIGGGWLTVHREGSAEYVYPRGSSQRCPGSLLRMRTPEPE